MIPVELLDEIVPELRVVAVDDHAVRNPRHKVLNVPGSHPDRDIFGVKSVFNENLRESSARRGLDALHAEHKLLFGDVVLLDPLRKAVQPLRGNGDDDDIRALHRLLQIGGQMNRRAQAHILVAAGIL